MHQSLRRPWIWLGCAACLALCIPIWRSTGVLDDALLGVPRWALVVVASAVAIPGLTARAVLPEEPERSR